MRYTKGPWHRAERAIIGESWESQRIRDANDNVVADVAVTIPPTLGYNGNAVLIEAAPELYAAVCNAADTIDAAIDAGEITDALNVCCDNLTALLARLEER